MLRLPFVTSGMSSEEIIRPEVSFDQGSRKPMQQDADQHQPRFENFASSATRIFKRSCEVDGHAVIRMLHFHPPERTGGLPLVLVPGLTSVIDSFRGVLLEITRTHEVIYIETREKPSSVTGQTCLFDMPSFARDLEVAIGMSGLKDDEYVLIGYSLGAAAIMEGFGRLPVKPARVVLAEPVPQFRIPGWSLPLAHLAPLLFPLIRPFAKWYMRKFMIDTEKDPEVMRIVERALDSADPIKLGRTIRALYRYEAWHHLPQIDRPTHIVATSGDTLHQHQDIIRMNELIPGSCLIDLVNNERTHSEEMAILLKELS